MPSLSKTTTRKSRFNHTRHRWLGMVARDPKLPGAAQRVAILLWEHMNADYGYAWPSLVYVAEQLGINKSTVVRSIKKLEAQGWIKVERRCGRHRGNRYRLAFGVQGLDGDHLDDTEKHDCDDDPFQGGGCSDAPKRLQPDNETVA